MATAAEILQAVTASNPYVATNPYVLLNALIQQGIPAEEAWDLAFSFSQGMSPPPSPTVSTPSAFQNAPVEATPYVEGPGLAQDLYGYGMQGANLLGQAGVPGVSYVTGPAQLGYGIYTGNPGDIAKGAASTLSTYGTPAYTALTGQTPTGTLASWFPSMASYLGYTPAYTATGTLAAVPTEALSLAGMGGAELATAGAGAGGYGAGVGGGAALGGAAALGSSAAFGGTLALLSAIDIMNQIAAQKAATKQHRQFERDVTALPGFLQSMEQLAAMDPRTMTPEQRAAAQPLIDQAMRYYTTGHYNEVEDPRNVGLLPSTLDDQYTFRGDFDPRYYGYRGDYVPAAGGGVTFGADNPERMYSTGLDSSRARDLSNRALANILQINPGLIATPQSGLYPMWHIDPAMRKLDPNVIARTFAPQGLNIPSMEAMETGPMEWINVGEGDIQQPSYVRQNDLYNQLYRTDTWGTNPAQALYDVYRYYGMSPDDPMAQQLIQSGATGTDSTGAPSLPAPPPPLAPPTGEEASQQQSQQALASGNVGQAIEEATDIPAHGGIPPQPSLPPSPPVGTESTLAPSIQPTQGQIMAPIEYQYQDPIDPSSVGGGYKKGGVVKGPGKKGSPVLIKAHKGEYIVDLGSTNKYKSLLDALNKDVGTSRNKNSNEFTLGMIALPQETRKLDTLVKVGQDFLDTIN